jgi:di/tricarboxylate transporter
MKRASLFVVAASIATLLPLSVQTATFVLGPATYINSGDTVNAYGAGYSPLGTRQ